MRASTRLLLALPVAALAACGGDDPPPPPGRDAYVPPDSITPDGTVLDLPPIDVVSDRPLTCNGGFRLCACPSGMPGRDFCVNRMFEGVCRCGDDAGPPPQPDASADADDDAATDAASQDVGLMDAAAD